MTEQQSTSIANDCVMEQEQKVVGGDWGSTTIPDSTEVDLNTDTLSDSITNVAKEIREYFNRVQHTIPANDNDSNHPLDPNTLTQAKSTLESWENLEEKVRRCTQLIHTKGLTVEQQKLRFKKAFDVAADYLRYELEIANVFNHLPSVQGTHTNQSYSKCRYLEKVLGIPYRRAWKVSKLTPELVEKTILFGQIQKELPTRRLALLCARCHDFEELKSALDQKKLMDKQKKEMLKQAKIQKGILDFNAIQNTCLNTNPVDTYNIIYVNPSASQCTIDQLKSLILPASENSVLFLWSNASDLKEYLELMQTWGFTYQDCGIWDRMDTPRMNKHFYNQHDLLLVGIKGNGLVASKKEKSITRIPLKDGESKPTYYTELIKTMYPGETCLDLLSTSTTQGVANE